MRLPTAIAALLLLGGLAAAQDTAPIPDVVQRPSDEAIRAALLEGYRRNNNSMVGLGSIDVSDLMDPKEDEIWPAPLAMPPKVKAPPVRVAEQNTCTRHGMRKSIRGKSWRCVR